MVLTVSVAVTGLEPVMAAGVVEPKESVGWFCAPVGLAVIAAARATLPVKPPAGDSVIVEVLPEVAPGATVTAEPLTVKLAPAAFVTVTEAVPAALE